MKFFGIFTIFVALTISVIAAYYSIVGLVSIFAASVIPIIVMGSALEVGKITTAIWLHLKWHEAHILIKTYLSSALVLLMFITSMGIFGFLSKAHIEQSSLAIEGKAQIENIETEIDRLTSIVLKHENKILELENLDDSSDDKIQEKIDIEQARIATIYDRLNENIAQLNDSLNSTISPYESQIAHFDDILSKLNEYIANNNIRKLQGLIGVSQDGQYGPNTAKVYQEYKDDIEEQRAELLALVTQQRQATIANIVQLRLNADETVAQSNELINRLRDRIGTTDTSIVEKDIEEHQSVISTNNLEIQELVSEKRGLESEARQFEAEVGPVKYIAELVYGNDPTTDTLEKAVRWVILILVVVFDPLAIVLVIAGLNLLHDPRNTKKPIVIDKKPIISAVDDLGTIIQQIQTPNTEMELTSEQTDRVYTHLISMYTNTPDSKIKRNVINIINDMKEKKLIPSAKIRELVLSKTKINL